MKCRNLENTAVLCISEIYLFAQKRFCGAEGLENVVNYPIFKKEILVVKNGLEIVDGP
jgi:thiol peroxidase